jgi:hypothetical protein
VLAQALADPGRPAEVREALLGLAGERRLEALRPVIAPLAIPSDPLEAPALTALALLDDGIPAEEVAELLGRQQEAVRLVAVVHGADAISDARLATLLRNDPAAEVRAAAVANLLRRSRFDALDEATPALFDPEGAVRSEAALQIAALGPEVVPTLAALVQRAAGHHRQPPGQEGPQPGPRHPRPRPEALAGYRRAKPACPHGEAAPRLRLAGYRRAKPSRATGTASDPAAKSSADPTTRGRGRGKSRSEIKRRPPSTSARQPDPPG